MRSDPEPDHAFSIACSQRSEAVSNSHRPVSVNLLEEERTMPRILLPKEEGIPRCLLQFRRQPAIALSEAGLGRGNHSARLPALRHPPAPGARAFGQDARIWHH